MLFITGNARPAPAARNALIAAIREVSAATQRDEGCLHYVFAASLDNDEIISVELWRDQAAFDTHMTHEHTRKFLSSIDGLLAGEPVMQQTEI